MPNVSNVRVYGLDEAIRASRFPMAVNTDEVDAADIDFWLNQGTFLDDFIKYQKEYGKEKRGDTKDSCYYCGSGLNVQKNNKIGHYVCSKHGKQIERYGECFETTPKYVVYDDRVECTVIGDQRKESTIIIDAIDLPLVFYSDSIHVTNNRVTLYDNKTKQGKSLYRCILNAEDDVQVDHVDRHPENNKRNNLRICTQQDNIRNRNPIPSNKTGIIGVCWSTEKNKWRSYIVVNYKQKHLGYYNDIEDAIIARLTAENECFGAFAPQKELFAQYGIQNNDDTNTSEIDYNRNFKKILKMYEVAMNLGQTPTGTGHSNFLKGIIVQFDLTISEKAVVQFERYRFFDIVSSCSTMHKLQAMKPKNCCNRYVDPRAVDILQEKIDEYNRLLKAKKEQGFAVADAELKQARLEMLYNIPSGMEITMAVSTNYLQLKTMLQQRRTHFLPDWQMFSDFIESLPRFMELTQRNHKNNA